MKFIYTSDYFRYQELKRNVDNNTYVMKMCCLCGRKQDIDEGDNISWDMFFCPDCYGNDPRVNIFDKSEWDEEAAWS